MTERFLTERQAEVLRFLADGHPPKKCVELLGMAEGTFKLHLHQAYTRLSARNGAHAVAIALRRRMIE